MPIYKQTEWHLDPSVPEVGETAYIRVNGADSNPYAVSLTTDHLRDGDMEIAVLLDDIDDLVAILRDAQRYASEMAATA